MQTQRSIPLLPTLAALAAACLLSSCGGGGGDAAPPAEDEAAQDGDDVIDAEGEVQVLVLGRDAFGEAVFGRSEP